jgi:hypothetical protein
MGARKGFVDHLLWQLTRTTWDGDDGYLQFGPDASTRITKTEIQGLWRQGHDYVEPLPISALVDRFAEATGITPTPATRQHVLDHLADPAIKNWMRSDALLLILSAPEMHMA